MRVHLDTPWPLQKVLLRATPLRMAYFAEGRLYVVLTSRPVGSQSRRLPIVKGGCLVKSTQQRSQMLMAAAGASADVAFEVQVAYRERQEEEPGGDPHASYAYAAANASAKAVGTEPGAEVGLESFGSND